MNDMSVKHPNHLTPAQIASELEISADGVRKLIRRRKLPGTKLSARKIVVSRAALDAYKRALNESYVPPAYVPPAGDGDLVTARKSFVEAVGKNPEQWLTDYKASDEPETADSLAIAAQAAALRSAELAAGVSKPTKARASRAKTGRAVRVKSGKVGRATKAEAAKSGRVTTGKTAKVGRVTTGTASRLD